MCLVCNNNCYFFNCPKITCSSRKSFSGYLPYRIIDAVVSVVSFFLRTLENILFFFFLILLELSIVNIVYSIASPLHPGVLTVVSILIEEIRTRPTLWQYLLFVPWNTFDCCLIVLSDRRRSLRTCV